MATKQMQIVERVVIKMQSIYKINCLVQCYTTWYLLSKYYGPSIDPAIVYRPTPQPIAGSGNS